MQHELQAIERNLEEVHSSLTYWDANDEQRPACIDAAYEHLDAALAQVRELIAALGKPVDEVKS